MSDAHHIDWRWTIKSIEFFGLHSSIALTIPAMMFKLFLSGSAWSITVLSFCYLIYLIFCRRFKFGPLEFFEYLRCRFLYGLQWRVRR